MPILGCHCPFNLVVKNKDLRKVESGKVFYEAITGLRNVLRKIDQTEAS